MLLCTAFMVSVFDKKNDQLKQTELTDYRLTIKGKYKPSSGNYAGPAVTRGTFIEPDTASGGIWVDNLTYTPVNARVDGANKSFVLDTFVYGYHEIAGTGSFSDDTLTLRLHYEPAGFAPADRTAYDRIAVLVKND